MATVRIDAYQGLKAGQWHPNVDIRVLANGRLGAWEWFANIPQHGYRHVCNGKDCTSCPRSRHG